MSRPSLSELVRFYRSEMTGRYEPPITYEVPASHAHRLSPAARRLFVRLPDGDPATAAFLARAREVSLWKELTLQLLRRCLSLTTANGLLDRGRMFVLSTRQARVLLGPDTLPLPPPSAAEKALESGCGCGGGAPSSATASDAGGSGDSSDTAARGASASPHRPLTLLDIGAGDGGVTSHLAPLFSRVFATEFSATMRFRLWRRGYLVLPHDRWFPPHCSPGRGGVAVPSEERALCADASSAAAAAATPPARGYDCIALMNVLDRADRPATLLRQMRDALACDEPGDGSQGDGRGVLLLALVLPWCPFVEDGAGRRAPAEPLPMAGGECCKGASYAESVGAVITQVFEPAGFEVLRWTRAPYLCDGNRHNAYALLNDAVFVLRRRRDWPRLRSSSSSSSTGGDGTHSAAEVDATLAAAAAADMLRPHYGYYGRHSVESTEGVVGWTGTRPGMPWSHGGYKMAPSPSPLQPSSTPVSANDESSNKEKAE